MAHSVVLDERNDDAPVRIVVGISENGGHILVVVERAKQVLALPASRNRVERGGMESDENRLRRNHGVKLGFKFLLRQEIGMLEIIYPQGTHVEHMVGIFTELNHTAAR